MALENLWEKTAVAPPATKILASAQSAYDLVVIGAGFSGCSAALTARDLGASVAVFEAKTIGYGGSGRNVGLVNAGLWTPPDEIEAAIGKREGAHLYESLSAAPDHVFSLIDRLNIECNARRNGTLHCAHADTGLADLKLRAKQLRARGAPVELLDANATRHRVGSDRFKGALFDPRAGTIQPLSYVRGLAKEALKAGAHLFENAPVHHVKKTSSGWMVSVGEQVIFAKALLLATNAYLNGLSGLPAPQFTKVGYFQAATRPLEPTWQRSILPGKEGCWDTAMVMSSFRMDGEGRLVIGGVGSLDSIGRGAHLAWAQRKLAMLFPQLAKETLQEAWSGAICMTGDHIPKILEIGTKGYALFGYSGRGIGPGTVFGATAAHALLTGDRQDLPVVPTKAHTEKLTGLKEVYYEAGATLTHMVSAR
ncbi:MAG: NAD(P)/FAD-dependent oxidoreductase [Cognatishimia activa]